MQKATRSAEVFTLVPKDDQSKPPAEQVTFHVRPLTQAERMHMYDEMVVTELKPDGARIRHDRSWQQARELVRDHVVQIDGTNGLGKWPVSEAEREAFLEQLDDFVVFEVGNEIRERAATRPTPGNPSPPATSEPT